MKLGAIALTSIVGVASAAELSLVHSDGTHCKLTTKTDAQGAVVVESSCPLVSSGSFGGSASVADVPPSSPKAGQLFFNNQTKSLEVFDGAAWFAMKNLVPPGSTSSSAGLSCEALLHEDSQLANGAYWVDLDGEGGRAPFQVFCDMAKGGYMIISHGTMTDFRTTRGTPSSSAGWGIDFNEFPSSVGIRDLLLEVDGGPSVEIKSITSLPAAGSMSLDSLVGATNAETWTCDAYTGGNCHFLDGEGNKWGRWAGSTACCGPGGAGVWFFRPAQGPYASNHNYGLCETLYTNGVVTSTNGCGAGNHVLSSTATFRFGVKTESPVAYTSCLTLPAGSTSGVYLLKPTEQATPFKAFCDQTVDGGGWLLVHSKKDTVSPWSATEDKKCYLSQTGLCTNHAPSTSLVPHTHFMWRFRSSPEPYVTMEASANTGIASFLRGASTANTPTPYAFEKTIGGVTTQVTNAITGAFMHYGNTEYLSESHGCGSCANDQLIDLWSAPDTDIKYTSTDGGSGLYGTKCIAGICRGEEVLMFVR